MLKRIAQRQGKLVEAGDTEVTLAPNEAVFIQQSFRLADHPGLTYELLEPVVDAPASLARMG